MLTFEQWLDSGLAEEAEVRATESGADYELDFDLDRWVEREYEKYRQNEEDLLKYGMILPF